ncbi:MAG: shikimate kinase [Planctomycetes bacterium]|nr:shikimate kinase [Planctomycetota bacterium]
MHAVTRTRRHVALVGLRCSGKSSVGRELAQLLHAPFVDLDDELTRVANSTAGSARFASAGDVLAQWGETTFRSLESQVLREVLEAREGRVLATGGGAVLAPANRAQLALRARCIWLRAGPAELARRLRADPTPRPSLTGRDPGDELVELARARGPLYAEVADWTLETAAHTPTELARLVFEHLVEDKSSRDGG